MNNVRLFFTAIKNAQIVLDKSTPVYDIIIVIVFCLLGILHVLFPYKMQQLSLRYYYWLNKHMPFNLTSQIEIAKKQSFIRFIRVFGVLFILISLSIIFTVQ